MKRILEKISTKFYILKIKIFKLLNIKKIKSRYGIYFINNYQDKTFNLYITASYGFFLKNFLTNKTNLFNFIDIGANQGLYSICAALNKNCKLIYAFEPIDKTFQLLKKNIEINNVGAKCKLYKKAIANKNKKEEVFFNENHTGKTSLITEKNVFGLNLTKIRIDTINHKTLNSIFCEKNKNEFVVKIDVEGLEQDVINELFLSKIKNDIHTIFFEYDIRWHNKEKLKDSLIGNGFKYFYQIGKNLNHHDIMASKSKIKSLETC